MAKELHELNELEERVILVAVRWMREAAALQWIRMRVWMSWRSW